MRDDRTTRRRYVLAVGTLGATALAGCSGDDGDDAGDGSTPGGDGGTSATPAAGTATPGGTSSETTAGSDATTTAALDPPPGTGEDGVEDRAVLVDATETALAENDYDLTQRQASTGSGGTDVTQHRRSSLDDERQLFVFDASAETNRVYYEDGVRYGRFTSDGETNYGSDETRESFAELHAPSMLGGPESLGGFFEFGSYTATETVTRSNRRLVRFALESASFGNDSYEVTDAEGELFVAAESVVFGAALSLTAEGDDETVTLEKGFGIEQLGDVTVERPDWFDEVPAPTTTPGTDEG